MRWLDAGEPAHQVAEGGHPAVRVCTTASTLGLVSIAAVLASLHTIVTIALARIVLKERLERAQQVGIAVSIIGVLAISAG